MWNYLSGVKPPSESEKKKESLKVPKSTTRGMVKISAQGNIYQSGKRVDIG
jgi:hypothetical protein